MIKKNISIFSGARQGSTYLFSVLHAYVNPYYPKGPIAGYEEFTNRAFFFNKGYSSEDYTDQLAKKLEELEMNPTCIVSKHHYDHLFQLKEENNGLLFRLLNINSYNILLIRKDLFATSLSHALAVKTGNWNEYLNTEPVEITIKEYDLSLQYCYSNLVNLINNPFRLSYDEIRYYEDLTFDPRQDFVSFGFNMIHEDNLKQYNASDFVEKSPPKNERVTNHDDLLDYTRGFIYKKTKHERFNFADTKLINIEVKTFS